VEEKVIQAADGTVICDLCDKEYTNSQRRGGFVMATYAVCPDCAPEIERGAINNNELNLITNRPVRGQSFADFCREIREKGAAGIKQVSFNNDEERNAYIKDNPVEIIREDDTLIFHFPCQTIKDFVHRRFSCQFGEGWKPEIVQYDSEKQSFGEFFSNYSKYYKRGN
jgi:hypothetical protein